MSASLRRVGVLASGAGTILQAVLDELHGGEVEVVGVASDKAGAVALDRARRAEVPTAVFALADHADREARDLAVAGWLEDRGAEVVLLAGYMAILTPPFVRRYAGRLVNVHPSLLPAFPGIGAIQQALDHGVKVFGVTVHLVDEGVDTGPVLLQHALALPGARTADEVREAVRPHEQRLVCEALRAFAAGTVRPDEGHPRRWLVG